MIECDWSVAPTWANFFVELEGGRAFWSSSEIKEMEWVPLLTNEELPNTEDVPGFYALSVVQCIPRPIRDTDGEDETLSWLPSPTKETA